MEKLTEYEIIAELMKNPTWKLIYGGKIFKAYQFADFVTAFAFLTSVALVAERRNHHPELFNCYNRVEFNLTTHDAGGVTKADFELAREIDLLAEKYNF